ncbi:hypothetical protein ACFQS1_20790 [Paractinoplanes rhizophilus]|jgi:hypothetical protein|uniref:Uncharacterized protein n=1 Tax=Paractinoplanes rhizophilus TaxID=1416877 RepID=A0ABW2HUE2_9ACTN|nr:hypothetical protein [Actinoplanes sp.]
MSNDETTGKPHDDSMRGSPIDDPIGEIALLAEDKDSDDAEILGKLEELGVDLTPDEIFAVLVRYDTPDVLG